MSKKRVRAHYRRYHRGSEPAIDLPLSAALRSALNFRIGDVALNDDVALRTYSDPDLGSIMLNGRLITTGGDVFGELVRFDPQTNIPLLMQNSASKAELEVRELTKPNDAEVLRGMTFFMIRGDHVLVIEKDLSNPAMERFLRWLFWDQAKVAQRNARIQLIPKMFLEDTEDALRGVKMVRLKPASARRDELDLTYPKSLQGRRELEPTTDILAILRAANFDTAVIERVMQENAAAVELSLTLRLKAGRGTFKMEGEDAVALLRNVPEDDLIVFGEGVRRNRGTLERLSDQVDVEQKGNILDRKDAWQALQKAAATYRDAGYIE